MENIAIVTEALKGNSVEISRTSKGEFSFCVKAYDKTLDAALAECNKIIALLEVDYPNPKGPASA